MKVSYYIVLFSVCFQGAMAILDSAGITETPFTPWNLDQAGAAFNATEIVESWDPSVNPFSDVGSGLRFLWNKNFPVIDSLVATLETFGTPSAITDPLRIIIRFTMMGLVISFISGKDFMP